MVWTAVPGRWLGSRQGRSRYRAARGISSEPADEADRGRHPGFARREGLAGGPGSLSLSFGSLIAEGCIVTIHRKQDSHELATLQLLDELGIRLSWHFDWWNGPLCGMGEFQGRKVW